MEAWRTRKAGTMNELRLVRPGEGHGEPAMAFREELLQNGDSFDGCAGLEDAESYGQWLCFEQRLRAKYSDS